MTRQLNKRCEKITAPNYPSNPSKMPRKNRTTKNVVSNIITKPFPNLIVVPVGELYFFFTVEKTVKIKINIKFEIWPSIPLSWWWWTRRRTRMTCRRSSPTSTRTSTTSRSGDTLLLLWAVLRILCLWPSGSIKTFKTALNIRWDGNESVKEYYIRPPSHDVFWFEPGGHKEMSSIFADQ